MIKKYLFHINIVILLAFLFSGCGSTQVKSNDIPKPKTVALVLGGGGARGFAHVGVIRELENAKIPIDLIVGTSVGSIIGALYAAEPDSFKLEWNAFQIQKQHFFDFKLFNIKDGLAKGEALMEFVNNHIQPKNIEELKIPLAIVATNLNTGEPVVFERGSIARAVRASTSVPAVFEPVPYQSDFLVDGGVVGNLAPWVAKAKQADVIIGVNIGKEKTIFHHNKTPDALTVILESINIMGNELIRLQRDDIDILIEPNVGQIGLTDFTHKEQLIQAGRKAAIQTLPQIKAVLDIQK